MTGPIRRGPYPELTLPAILVGYLIGSAITVSIGYASLMLGFSIEGSELAAILGFGVLRGILRRNSIIENNINQTIASGVNSASAGMMFSVPALFILNRTDFNPYFMVLGCIAGAIMGIAFIIPLRKQMIDYNRLTFPGGVAVATILKSPGAGMRKSYYLMGGFLLSAGLQVWSQLSGIADANIGVSLGLPSYMNGIWFISLMTVGVGYIAGRGGFYFVIGGFVCYWVLAPLLDKMHLLPSLDPNVLRTTMFRPVGIGMLIGGALTGILLAFPLVISAIRSMQSAAKTKSTFSADELPVKLLYFAIAGAAIVLFIIALNSTREMGIGRGLLMAVMGTLWIWVAGIILSECIGRTNWSPLSGMTLIGITILIFIASGLGDNASVIASVMVGAAMCVAMSQATDLMLDLKTGYLVGALPRKQQIAQLCGTWLGPIIIMLLIFTLNEHEGLGGTRYPAPQGQALASMINGVLGGDVPMEQYVAGAGLGAILSASGIGGLGVLVGLGFYLPFNIVLTYAIGILLRLFSDRKYGVSTSESVGIPIAAGFIVGEALIGVFFAITIVFFPHL